MGCAPISTPGALLPPPIYLMEFPRHCAKSRARMTSDMQRPGEVEAEAQGLAGCDCGQCRQSPSGAGRLTYGDHWQWSPSS